MRSSPTLAALLCVASLLTAQAADKPAEKPVKDAKESAGTRADGKNSADKSKDDKDVGRKPRSRLNKDGKEIRVCNLRFCWWNQPENPPELALQMEKSRQPIVPDTMALSNLVEYEGEPTVAILRKNPTGGLDRKGKPIETWEPYASFTLRPTDDDLGVVLFEIPGKIGAQPRLFDFTSEAFPYGSMRIVNFTRSKVFAALSGEPFPIEPGASARAPKIFTQRTRAHFAVAIQEADGSQHMLDSSAIIFYPSFRSLTFVVEKPGAEANERFHVQSIMDSAPIQIARPAAVVATGLTEAIPTTPEKKSGADKTTPDSHTTVKKAP